MNPLATLFIGDMEFASSVTQSNVSIWLRVTRFTRVSNIVSGYSFDVSRNSMVITTIPTNETVNNQSAALNDLNNRLENYIACRNIPYTARFEAVYKHTVSGTYSRFNFILIKTGALDRKEELVDVLSI